MFQVFGRGDYLPAGGAVLIGEARTGHGLRWYSWFPRFSARARAENQPIVDTVWEVAAAHNATPARISLAWLLAQRPWIVPIPGTRRLERLQENIGADSIELTAEELDKLDVINATGNVHGARGTGRESYGWPASAIHRVRMQRARPGRGLPVPRGR